MQNVRDMQCYKPTGIQIHSCLPEESLWRSLEVENCSTGRGLQKEEIMFSMTYMSR